MNKKAIRVIERNSIRVFLQRNKQYLTGRVLDYGCGIPGKCIQPQPYKDLITGDYVPYDRGYPEPTGHFDAVLLTQVIQFIPDLLRFLSDVAVSSKYLVATYPTHWEEIERDDLWRLTKCGMEALLIKAGFKVLIHERRWSLPYEDFELAGGYAVVAESNRCADNPGNILAQ